MNPLARLLGIAALVLLGLGAAKVVANPSPFPPASLAIAPSAGSPAQGGAPDLANAGNSLSPVQPQSLPASASAADGLSPAETRSWCVAGPCDQHRFEPLQEANGALNPRGVHMTTGNPVAINLPAGISADIWDCFNASQVTGPATLPQVCEATFRRIQ